MDKLSKAMSKMTDHCKFVLNHVSHHEKIKWLVQDEAEVDENSMDPLVEDKIVTNPIQGITKAIEVHSMEEAVVPIATIGNLEDLIKGPCNTIPILLNNL